MQCHEVTFEYRADLVRVDDLHLEFEVRLAGGLESRLECCQGGIIRSHAHRTEYLAHRALIPDRALADDDMSIAVAELQPELA